MAIFTPEERSYFAAFMSRNSAGDEFLIGLSDGETKAFLDYRRRAVLGTTARPGLMAIRRIDAPELAPAHRHSIPVP